jgi:hypothetical protein
MIKEKYSILSVDSNPDYLFFVPITCAFWRKLGYNPYVVLVDQEISEPILELIVEYSYPYEAHINRFPHIDGYRTCNVAQISRLYAAADPLFDDDDYLITDDMDKFVVSAAWLNQQDFKKDIHIYDPDELNFTRLKIGNIGMTASTWKKVIGIEEGSLRENLIKSFEKHLSKDADWNTGWNLDEWILTTRVFKSGYYPGRCQMLTRGANQYGIRNGRIDRGAWKPTFEAYMQEGLIDVHLHRDPYEDNIWADTKAIMTKVFTDDEIAAFEEYKIKFVELL